ncbi:uncharacterized protein LOC135476138 [Liolophura sinensis]|uniref:uncharacterized protein LOC135476138 n=1 Tax=Liolophura sinensis TaxID=3198878 RepID=UPI003158160A
MTTELAESSRDVIDVMISYNPADVEHVRHLAGALRAEGLSVWFSDMDNPNLGDTGQAVSQCKVFVLVLSEKSACDPQCKDELALAYITDSSIFPVGLQRFRDLGPLLDCGMKLMLAKINWTFFVKPEDFEKNFPGLLSGIQNGIESSGDKSFPIDEDNPFQFLNSLSHVTVEETDENLQDFWPRNFGDKREVSWVNFKNAFVKDYGEEIEESYTEENLNQRFFVNVIYKDIFDLRKEIKRDMYDQFCDGNPQGDPHCFYSRLQEYARGLYAMKEVFNMDSTLRLTVVQNLGKFSTPAVVARLLEMMSDQDPNIRAVTAIALARSNARSKKSLSKLMKALEDEDRLVRESACFALGFLQAASAVEAIADRWRNDPISHVRTAASEALKMMDNEEARKCVHMTEVLTGEMQSLRTEESK